MGYRVAADGVLIVHAAFVLVVALGGLLLLRWPRLAWLQLPAVIWAVLLEINGWVCPLTPLEVTLRQMAGDAGYAGGFVDHYVASLLYPRALTREVQTTLGVVIVLVNAVIYAAVAMRWRRGPK